MGTNNPPTLDQLYEYFRPFLDREVTIEAHAEYPDGGLLKTIILGRVRQITMDTTGKLLVALDDFDNQWSVDPSFITYLNVLKYPNAEGYPKHDYRTNASSDRGR